MKYAAYDMLSIYGIGDAPGAAVSQARLMTKEPDADFYVAPIADTLADDINRYGWSPLYRSFIVDENGYLIEINA